MALLKRRKTPNSKRGQKRAPKAPFSFRRNILPPLIGMAVMVVVFGILNGQLIEAQIKYRFAKPVVAQQAAVVVNPADTKSPNPSGPPTLTIPKISVSAPIEFAPSAAEWAVQLALRQGVDHYSGTADPGQPGNTVIFGHSSGQLWAPGNYKFVFTLLNKMQAGDQLTIDYKGTRYTYKVTSTEIILPTNLSVLNQNSTKPSLTLITCTPVGTSKYRFVVHAAQISPAPLPESSRQSAAQPANKIEPRILPGSAHASFWSSLFGWL